MSKLDTIIAEVNGDLQDCLAPVAARFRQAMSDIFDYCVANPAQGNPATAQTAIATAFKVHYPDGLISPGITIEQGTLAFVNRHGVGATTALKWVSVRDFIVERSGLKSAVLLWLEEENIPDLATLWFRRITGHDAEGVFTPPQDTEYVETRKYDVPRTDPRYGYITMKVWSSASLGKSVRQMFTLTVSNGVVVPENPPYEVV